MDNILKEVTTIAPFICEEDFKWIVPKVVSYYAKKINYLGVMAYGISAKDVTAIASKAFHEQAKSEIESALRTFILKSKHWEKNRNLDSYLQLSLKRLASRIKWADTTSAKKNIVLICPGCKFIGNKEFLLAENKLWRCRVCTKEIERLPLEIKHLKHKKDRTKTETESIVIFESRLRLHGIFSLHSRLGYKCLDCNGFIPNSANGIYGISCPYNNCLFFGKITELEKLNHPVGLCYKYITSLQETAEPKNNISFDCKKSTLQDFLQSKETNPDIKMTINENLENDINIINQVIKEQIESIKRTNTTGTIIRKLLMYEAFELMVDKNPTEMISYLIHRKQISDFPVQAQIFQKYIDLIENSLPFDIIKSNKIYTITSLIDPNLQLFLGVSEFEAEVKHNYIISNNTKEIHIGEGTKCKYYGPCFIGLLVDIQCQETKKSIMDKVNYYTFAQINMKPNEIKIGSKVLVKHYRILPHYEMGGLVLLQRTRKKIVDSIYLRLNGKKRIVGEKPNAA